MLIRKITLENYGLFQGKVSFDLVPRNNGEKKQPIILFGGENGSGKTTLLDAIKILFYGKNALGDRVSNDEYYKYIRERIHKPSNRVIKPDYARIGIEFDYVYLGKENRIYVERSWKINQSKSLKEYLIISKNGNSEKNVDREFWDGFIDEIIPQRLSQLFFFDGEKIKSLANDNTGSESLADAIKNLLGLDIVERLNADISIYRTRELKRKSLEIEKDQLKIIENQIAVIKEEIEDKIQEKASIQTKIDRQKAQIRKCEQKLQLEGGYYASKRKNLQEQKFNCLTKIEEIKKQIRKECESTFPFSLCPSITEKLVKQIELEEKTKKAKALIAEFDRLENELLTDISITKVWFDESVHETVSKIIGNVFKKRKEKNRQYVLVQRELEFSSV